MKIKMSGANVRSMFNLRKIQTSAKMAGTQPKVRAQNQFRSRR